ncbi:hybrid sensor histidine kinase/response regulator [Arachidicoccus soli]|uniref:histidine kinase n=2 Tax=Arachidicoccus soli TaxID=2341117 RepID=A0A386HS51_9BACT|nr:hybrid sensor histidine kinase/response regulator [Arachidicoccus soli]
MYFYLIVKAKAKMLKKSYLLFLLIYFIGIKVNAQKNIVLNNLSFKDGLSNNSVTCLMQDSYGFMWMGTYDGLNRYDGYSFKIFRNRWKDTTSLINNHVVALNQNNANSIWVGTLKGVSLFDYKKLKFSPSYYTPWGKTNIEIIDARVRDIISDSLGNTFVATENSGLLEKGKGNDCFYQIAYQNTPNFNASALCLYKQNEIFVFIKDVGLCLFNKYTHKFSVINTTLNDATKLLFWKEKNALLVGTERGLYIYDLKTGVTNVFNVAFQESSITNLLLDKEGILWISTDGNGVAKIILKTENVSFIKEGLEGNSLKSNAVYAIYEDASSKKWIATLRGGVSILNPKPKLFKLIQNDPYNKNSLISNFVLSFCEDQKNNIWIGTDGGGLSYWDPSTSEYRNYVHNNSNPNSPAGNYVVSVLCDYKNRIWIATFNGGVDLFNPDTKSFIHYRCFNPIRKKYDVNFWKLFQDSKHHIWLGSTLGNALFRFNENENKFELFDNSLINIHTLFEDTKGRLWGGDYDQLIKIDTLHRNHIYFNVGFPVRAIIQDNQQNIWLGTEGGGLQLFNEKDKSFTHFTEKNGLPSNSILNILKDRLGNLWCSTYNGLTEFDPQTKSCINFNTNDGLQSNQFSYNAALKLSNGAFLFGGINGFNMFYPNEIKKAYKKVPLIITDFKINNVPIQNTDYLSQDYTPVNFQSIRIPFNRANISFNYTGLEYAGTEDISYEYILKGWDKAWNKVGTVRSATYSHLYEGHYKLLINTIYPDGTKGRVRVIDITVLPPWYRSWWAYCLYLIAFGMAVYLYLRYRQNQIRLTYEMRITKMNADAEKEMNERKISFFTNISHEFRTMLTLIVNPIKELMKSDDGTEKPVEIQIAYKNSRRMLSLVGQLLLFRKVDVEEYELKISRLNLYEIGKDVFDSFIYQAKTKRITYTYLCENEKLEIYGDFEKLEIALFNLISNAMKYTPEYGEIILEIKEDDEKVFITISDSGQGISEEIGEKIFQKYYQIHSLESRTKTGFGIGLYLVKNFIETHHGAINYKSRKEKGTTFIIELLKGKNHFKGIEIAESEYHEKGLVEEIIDQEDTNFEEGSPIHIASPENFSEKLISDKKTILIADDNAEIRNYVLSLFNKEYNVIQCDNGKTALELIIKKHPDLVILDLIMPKIYGDELCQQIKSDKNLNHIPVVILTAEVSAEIKLRCVESGADDYITKPFEKEFLIARVNNLLNTKNNLQKYFYNEITLQENNQNISPEDKIFLDKCIEIVEENIDNTEFDIKILADEMCMSHSKLYKKIHYISGYSASGFVRFVRLRKAAELFINSNHNVSETALIVGFGDVKYFRTQFQKTFGMTPSNYIKKYRKPFQDSYSL